MDDYPYISSFVSYDEMMQAWENLQKFKGTTTIISKYKLTNTTIDTKYKSKYQVIHTNNNDYFEINFITEYFTEYSRVRAKRFDQELSSYDYWNKFKHVIKRTAIHFIQFDH
jgi:hypothetical protein